MKERCPMCSIPVGEMPEDAASDEMMCNRCYEIFDAEQQEAFARDEQRRDAPPCFEEITVAARPVINAVSGNDLVYQNAAEAYKN